MSAPWASRTTARTGRCRRRTPPNRGACRTGSRRPGTPARAARGRPSPVRRCRPPDGSRPAPSGRRELPSPRSPRARSRRRTPTAMTSRAPLVAHAQVQVVGEGPQQQLDRGGRARRRRVGEDRPVDARRRAGTRRSAGRRTPARARRSDRRRPAPDEEVGQVHDVVGVQVGEEDGAHQRAAGVVIGVERQPGPPQLGVRALAAVDEVGGVADHDGVGYPPRRLRVGPPAVPRARPDRRRRCDGAPARPEQRPPPGRRRRGAARSASDAWHTRAHGTRRRGDPALVANDPFATEVLWRATGPSRHGRPAGGFDVTTTRPTKSSSRSPDEIEGFWALDKMHAPRPVTPLSFDLVVQTLARGLHQGPGRVRLPDHGDPQGGQPLLLRGVPPDPRRGRDRRPHDAGTTTSWPTKVPGVGRTWEEQWKPEVIGPRTSR